MDMEAAIMNKNTPNRCEHVRYVRSPEHRTHRTHTYISVCSVCSVRCGVQFILESDAAPSSTSSGRIVGGLNGLILTPCATPARAVPTAVAAMRKSIREARDAIARRLLYRRGVPWREAVALADEAIRCGAKTKAGTRCRRKGVPPSWRCVKHGGGSTGPRTPEGKARALAALAAAARSPEGRERSRRNIAEFNRRRRAKQVDPLKAELTPPTLAASKD